jgi:predicted alpha/beta superfamily hydrolase
VAVHSDGRREVLGVSIGASEAETLITQSNEFRRRAAGNPTIWLRTEAIAIEFRCGSALMWQKLTLTG